MNKYFVFQVFAFLFFISCNSTTGQKSHELNVADFAAGIVKPAEVQIVDVRTPEEYRSGYIENAMNINVNGSEFESQVSALDKSKPVYVYCRSGARSATAAEYMRKNGFKNVLELKGGMMKWEAEKQPVIRSKGSKDSGMKPEQYRELVNSEKLVLVDFHAKWCAPCRKMAPLLEEIKSEKSEVVSVLKIDVDENPALIAALGIDEIPVLKLYKSGNEIWTKKGFTGKDEIVTQLVH